MNIQLTDETLVRQIGQIAERTRQTPGQLIARALERYIRDLPPVFLRDEAEADETPACDEETEQMSLEAIMDKTRTVLRDLADNADRIMAESEPGRPSGFLEVMNRLSKRIDKVGNEHDLIAIANIVYDLTIEIPDVTDVMNTPEDELPRHFRTENLRPSDDNGHIENQKAALEEVFNPSFKRIEQAWRDMPRSVPANASIGPKETPWHLMGIFKDDPTWGEIFDEIERERDKDWVWLGGEAE
ncbi:MAG: hypothetical protein DRI57_30420 [Deltaproteobacteria bacterium]|nr:MAG: hypothetical protein DRI57_30420 [Deltaproteobacteria bacterium]